ncbi:hypothetical protein [Streptomyces sp. NPDC059649]|uniref:hypothetical protein n=1 Tax=Streptomyces sp. NPDC059649 TaxID=3346895 RepID=UPI0036ABBDA4
MDAFLLGFGFLTVFVAVVVLMRIALRPHRGTDAMVRRPDWRTLLRPNHVSASGMRALRRLAREYEEGTPAHRTLRDLVARREWAGGPRTEPRPREVGADVRWDGWMEILGRSDRLARKCVREVQCYVGSGDFPFGGWETIPPGQKQTAEWAKKLEPSPRTVAFELINLGWKPWGARRFVDPRTRAPVVQYRNGTLRIADVWPRPEGGESDRQP